MAQSGEGAAAEIVISHWWFCIEVRVFAAFELQTSKLSLDAETFAARLVSVTRPNMPLFNQPSSVAAKRIESNRSGEMC